MELIQATLMYKLFASLKPKIYIQAAQNSGKILRWGGWR
jgi:hypothetical protein